MNPATIDDPRLDRIYEAAADRYLRSLTLENIREATPQATQRKITVGSFDLVHDARPDVQCFSELLIQYPPPGGGTDQPAGVVPDNMVVVHPDPLPDMRSYKLPLLRPRPLVVFEYVSNSNKRKDYEDNFDKYERELKVPYYLRYYPDGEELTVFHRRRGKYVAVRPNPAGRLEVPELELEVALLDRYTRYWFRGELLPLPADLRRERDAERAGRLAAERGQAAAEQAAEAERAARQAAEAELARMRDELARLKGSP